jgi:hypothetical protein
MENTPNEQQINQQFNQQFGNNPMGQVALPNSAAVLVLGIISIALCWCYGVVALTCGIIALVLGNKGMSVYKANPNAYTLSSYNNLKAGRVCAIIGICLASLMVVYVIIVFAFLGAAFSAMPWESFR